MDEIIKIVLKRNKERKLLTPTDVKKICFIILNKNHYNFVKNVVVFGHNPNDENCAGVYHGENIFFFFDGIINMLQNNVERFRNVYQIDGASVDLYNYFYLCIIFHELAHVRQYSIINSKHSSLEKKLFTMFLSLSKNRDFYNENYSNILTEVNANNVSIITTNYIYGKFPKNFLTENDRNIYNLALLKMILYNNYEIIQKKDDILSPAERVMSKFDEEILFYLDTDLENCVKLIYDNDFTIYKKIMLGLPISYQEYAYCNLLCDRKEVGEDINIVKKLQKRI